MPYANPIIGALVWWLISRSYADGVAEGFSTYRLPVTEPTINYYCFIRNKFATIVVSKSCYN